MNTETNIRTEAETHLSGSTSRGLRSTGTLLCFAALFGIAACSGDDDTAVIDNGIPQEMNEDESGDMVADGGDTMDGDMMADGDGPADDHGDDTMDGDMMAGGDDTMDGDMMAGGDGPADDHGDDTPATLELRVELTGLEPLAGDFEYEGWFIRESGPVSAGRFNLTEGEASVDVTLPAEAVDGASMYVLTIEPPLAQDDPGPSPTHVLAGPWDGTSAPLDVASDAALGDDFSSAAGEFFLQTPTSADPDDYSLGIWFISPGMTMAPGLTLPELPEGWAYEGWVAGPDGPVSTGRFLDPAVADDDGAGPSAGDLGAPPFPGQDFIDPQLDLLGADFSAVISVEPEPDDSPAPFAFKPLAGAITDEGPGGVQLLDNLSSTAPSGTVSLVQ